MFWAMVVSGAISGFVIGCLLVLSPPNGADAKTKIILRDIGEEVSELKRLSKKQSDDIQGLRYEMAYISGALRGLSNTLQTIPACNPPKSDPAPGGGKRQ